MPTASGLTLLPAAGPDLLGGYLAAIAAGAAQPPELIALPVSAADPPVAASGLDPCLPVPAADVISRRALSGKPGELAETMASVGDEPVRVVFVGIGDGSPRALRRAGAELGRLAAGHRLAVPAVGAGQGESLQAFAEGLLLGSYRFSLASRGAAGPARPSPGGGADGGDAAGDRGATRLLVGASAAETAAAEAAVQRAALAADAVALARDLTNTPSAVKSPQWLGAEAARLAAEHGLEARIWSATELAERGFGGIVAVGGGSARPPVLIELSYHPPGAATHVVLVGKGITFDSGGLSLKPNDGMKLMKTDMAGGAAVIAAMTALARLGVTCRVTGLVAAAENLPSGSAYRPGDVITQFGGRTVEVLNTDAEGRLVLADALAYADSVLQPDVMVDVATLTGAVRIALGSSYGGLYSTSDSLAHELIMAGDNSGDRLWRLPLAQEYRPALDSAVADLCHISSGPSRDPGSILAALFLREFTGGRAWAHLDIAGAGRSAADDGELTKGATGFGARLLLSWLSALPG